MKLLKVIGTHDASIKYVDRPTVKTLVLNSDNKILIINEGLLPGGGVENDESNFTALNRELLEEIGIEVTDQQEIGCVVQYRDFLKRKYLVYGYTSLYKDTVAIPTPQDDREAQFVYDWYSIEDAQRLLEASISKAANDIKMSKGGDTVGKLFNLMTTQLFLDSFAESSYSYSIQ